MPVSLCVALIPLCASLFGVLGFLAVAFVEFIGDEEENFLKYLRPSGPLRRYTRSNWKPLSGAACAAVLAGGSAAEFTFPSFAKGAEGHPVLSSALTGALWPSLP